MKLFQGAEVGFIFDGAGHHGDMLAVLARKSENFRIYEKLIELKHSDKVFDHESLNDSIIGATTSLGITTNRARMKAFSHDAHSANLLAIKQLKAIFSSSMDLVCASHILQRVGERFVAPLVDELIASWFRLFKNGTNKIALWRSLTGVSFPSFNPIKWHSRFQLARFIMENFQSLLGFLDDPLIGALANDDGTPKQKIAKSVVKMKELVVRDDLKIQLAAYVDFGEHLVISTYGMEGNGPNMLLAHSYVTHAYDSLKAFLEAPDPTVLAPNLRQVIASLEAPVPPYLEDVRAIIRPAVTYFDGQKTKHPDFFKFLEIADGFCPWSAPALTEMSLAFLLKFKVISYDEMNSASKELKTYESLAKDSPIAASPKATNAFLKRNCKRNNLPEWLVFRWWYQMKVCPTLRKIVNRLALYQPTSASAERVFSLFRHHLKENMSNASAEYLRLQTMLNYNESVDPMKEIDLEKAVTAPL